MILAPEAANSREDCGIYWNNVPRDVLIARIRRLERENEALWQAKDAADREVIESVKRTAEFVANLTHGAGLEEQRLAELAAKVSS